MLANPYGAKWKEIEIEQEQDLFIMWIDKILYSHIDVSLEDFSLYKSMRDET